jgi:hypothetical protein
MNLLSPAMFGVVFGLACILFNKPFARWANGYRRLARLQRHDDYVPLRIAYIAAGSFFVILNLLILFGIIGWFF